LNIISLQERVKNLFNTHKSKIYENVEFFDLKRLEEKIESNNIDEYKNVGLVIAVVLNDLKLIDYFISCGADVNTKSVVEFNQYDNCISSILCFAIHLQRSDAAISLIRKGANVNGIIEPRDSGFTSRSSYRPIFLASLYITEINVIEELLKYGANPNEYDIESRKDKVTVLMNVVSKNCIGLDHYKVKVIELLAKYGADLNKVDHCGKTALHYSFSPDCVATLIRLGANLDQVDNKGDTPLMLAIKELNYQKVEILLKAGANIKIKNSDGYTPESIYTNYPMRKIIIDSKQKKLDINFHRAKFEKIRKNSLNDKNLSPEERQLIIKDAAKRALRELNFIKTMISGNETLNNSINQVSKLSKEIDNSTSTLKLKF
jgi:ankyrin repeat protein